MDIIGWCLAVVLAVPAIWFAALAYRESKSANVAATKSNVLSEAALELATKQSESEAREGRAAFVEKVRNMAALTDDVGFDPTEVQYTDINARHGDLQHEATVIGIPGATELAWYAALVHFRPDDRRRRRNTSPRHRPNGIGEWFSLDSLARQWIDAPEAVVEKLRCQGQALIGMSDAVFNIKQWPRPW